MTAPRSTLLLVLAWLFAGAFAFAAPQDGPDPEHETLARARLLYQPQSWPAGPRRAGLALAALALPGLGESALEHDGAVFARTWRDRQGRPALRVEAVIAADVAGAREAMLPWLAWVSSPRPLQAGAEVGLAVGDAAFAAPAGASAERLAWAAMIRGNVAVRVLVLEPGSSAAPDLRAAAARVDRLLLAAPRLAPAAALPRPVVTGLTPDRRRCDSSQTVALGVDWRDPAGEPVLLQWQVAGAGSGYVEEDAQGTPRFHPTGPGPVEVQLVLVGRSGAATGATTKFEVLDA